MTKQRNTVQKTKILNFLRSVHNHPTAEQVHEAVKKDLSNISLATVYRNLNQMASVGKILRLEINGEFHFDGDISKHQHGYCSNCGTLFDIFNKKINDYAIKNINLPNFEISSVQVLFTGVCTECVKKK